MRTKRVPPPEKRCQEKRKDGAQCRAARLRKSEYCLFHHPWTQRHLEGLERLREMELRESSEIHELLAEAVEGVKSGRLSAQQAYALTGLVRALRENRGDVEEEEASHEEALKRYEDLEEPEFGEASERETVKKESEVRRSSASGT